MLFVLLGSVRAGTDRERIARRVQWSFPPRQVELLSTSICLFRPCSHQAQAHLLTRWVVRLKFACRVMPLPVRGARLPA